MPWVLSMGLSIALPLFAMYYYNVRVLLHAFSSQFGWDRKTVTRWVLILCVYLNLLPLLALLAWLTGGRQATAVFSGDVPVIDYMVVYPFWFSLVITVQMFLFFLLWETGKLVLFPLYRRFRDSWKKAEPKYVIGIFLFTLIYSTTTIYANTWVVRVNERTVKLPEQFAPLDGFRIVQISDIQGDGRTTPARIAEYVQRVNSLKPDLILYGGDVVTSGQTYVASTIRQLEQLSATYGKIAAVGDHDQFSGKKPIIQGLTQAGFWVVEDSTISLRVRDVPVIITVLTYTYRQRPSEEVLARATNNGNEAYKILLVHQPREELVHYASERGYHIFAAGHTHGGAIAFGIPGVYLWAPSRVETKYFSGFYEVGQMLVSVTNGLGHTLAPIRYHAPIEITLLKLAQ
jgi:predicted MPP superfamily phosphohydrolase